MRTFRWVLLAMSVVMVSCSGGSLSSNGEASTTRTNARTDEPKQVQIEAWSVLPRPKTERITLFQDAYLTIYAECAGSAAVMPRTDVYFVGVERDLTVPVDMGYAIEATTSSMSKFMFQSGLNSTPTSPWGPNIRVLDGVVTTTLTSEGGYRVWLSILPDDDGRCNFRGMIQPGQRP
jgi:hypothetical protein